MAYFPENENLVKIERSAEDDIREMQRQLNLGLEQAKKEFKQHQASFREAAERNIARIDELADEAESGLLEIQRCLGGLNYFVAEEKLDDPQVFDAFRQDILLQMDNTLQKFRMIQGEAGKAIREERALLENTWRKFSSLLELLAIHLAQTNQETAEDFHREKQRLIDRLAARGTEPEDDKSLKTELMESFENYKQWLKAFLQHPDVASPGTPRESENQRH